MNDAELPKKGAQRRTFLKTSGVMAAGAMMAAGLDRLPRANAAGNDTLKIAVIGVGGRGSGAAIDCINAGGNVKIVAIADAFEHRAKQGLEQIQKAGKEKVDVAPDKVFVGLDAYQKAIDSGVDMVILATPPGFRPQHYEAAVKAGKHIFMEKPICIDPGGYRKVMSVNKLAEEKKLKVAVGLQRHHQAPYLGMMEAIRDGKMGDITLLRAYWNGNGIWQRPRTPGQTEMQYQVNNWYHFVWLSGDNICEQHIHNLDVCNWVMTNALKKEGSEYAHPVEANGMGASITRGYNGKDLQGQLFDAHFVEFTYENGTKMFSQCRHQPGTWSNVSEAIHSTNFPKGTQYAGTAPKVNFANPYVQEHYDLQQAIVNDKPYHEGWHGAASAMTSVMGRYATYSGKIVKWDDLIKLPDDSFPTQLAWDANPPVMPDSNGFYPIPTPGLEKKKA